MQVLNYGSLNIDHVCQADTTAAAIAVTRPGASTSIPTGEEVRAATL